MALIVLNIPCPFYLIADRSTMMIATKITPIHSAEFLDLQRLFHSLERPYGLLAILRFNRAYEAVYWRLGTEERRRAEEFVDKLIEGVERSELKARIFGVV